MPVLKPSHLVYLVLVVAGVAIYMHKAEREEMEANTFAAGEAACDARDDAAACHARLERDHEDCFVMNFQHGRGANKYDRQPDTVNTRGYVSCITKGYEAWRESRPRKRTL